VPGTYPLHDHRIQSGSLSHPVVSYSGSEQHSAAGDSRFHTVGFTAVRLIGGRGGVPLRVDHGRSASGDYRRHILSTEECHGVTAIFDNSSPAAGSFIVEICGRCDYCRGKLSHSDWLAGAARFSHPERDISGLGNATDSVLSIAPFSIDSRLGKRQITWHTVPARVFSRGPSICRRPDCCGCRRILSTVTVPQGSSSNCRFHPTQPVVPANISADDHGTMVCYRTPPPQTLS